MCTVFKVMGGFDPMTLSATTSSSSRSSSNSSLDEAEAAVKRRKNQTDVQLEPWSASFWCCNQQLHAIPAATIIAVFHALLTLLGANAIRQESGYPSPWHLLKMGMLSVELGVAFMLLYGILSKNHWFLLPYLAYSVNALVFLISCTFISLFCLLYRPVLHSDVGGLLVAGLSGVYGKPANAATAGLLLCTTCMSLLCTAHWLSVVWTCFRYLRAYCNNQADWQRMEKARYMPKWLF